MRPAALPLAVFLLGMPLASARLYADPITFTSGTIEAIVTYPAVDPTSTATVTTLPYSTPDVETSGGQSSTVTPTLTTSAFSLAFNQILTGTILTQSAASPAAAVATDFADGNAILDFTAGPNVSYVIAGSLSSAYPNSQVTLSFQDTTADSFLYKDQQTGTSLTVGTSSFPLTGTLTAGDAYQFYADENVSAPVTQTPNVLTTNVVDATLTGAVSITFAQTVPEPGSAAALLLAATALAAKRSPRTESRR